MVHSPIGVVVFRVVVGACTISFVGQIESHCSHIPIFGEVIKLIIFFS